jgi:hypothetical protein
MQKTYFSIHKWMWEQNDNSKNQTSAVSVKFFDGAFVGHTLGTGSNKPGNRTSGQQRAH